MIIDILEVANAEKVKAMLKELFSLINKKEVLLKDLLVLTLLVIQIPQHNRSWESYPVSGSAWVSHRTKKFNFQHFSQF